MVKCLEFSARPLLFTNLILSTLHCGYKKQISCLKNFSYSIPDTFLTIVSVLWVRRPSHRDQTQKGGSPIGGVRLACLGRRSPGHGRRDRSVDVTQTGADTSNRMIRRRKGHDPCLSHGTDLAVEHITEKASYGLFCRQGHAVSRRTMGDRCGPLGRRGRRRPPPGLLN